MENNQFKPETHVNYDVLSEKYDMVRNADLEIIRLFLKETPLERKTILDFGCGTGNFAHAIKKLTNADVYGVEPSLGMREKAIAKGNIAVKEGDHTNIPYEDGFFDFVYMTDVIHHVPDLSALFTEMRRVMKVNALACVMTESHNQLETRYWVKYFPAAVEIEKRRYPDIPEIIASAEKAGLSFDKSIITDDEFQITPEFIKLVENKGYSIFHLIDEDDYQKGLKALKTDSQGNQAVLRGHGETLAWFRKI